MSAQVQHKSTGKDRPLGAAASCYEESTGKLIGSNRSRTAVLMSPDGRYRAYAESEAVASQATNAGSSGCQNTSRLFVASPKSKNFRPVLVIKPLPERHGNDIELVDWSPAGHHLLLAQGWWEWGSDVGGIVVRTYDADSENLSSEFLVDEAFSKYVGKNCAGVFHPVGFSSSGKVVVTAAPFFDVGEDKPVEDSCVQQEGFWLIDTEISAASQLPDNYRVERYARDFQITRLAPSAFPELPVNIRRELERRRCTIPQVRADKKPQNVIKGEFTRKGQIDWAALCSVNRVSTILVFRNASERNPSELAREADIDKLQAVAGDVIAYSRTISRVGREYILSHYGAYGGPKPPTVDHQGIDDAFEGKASIVHYFHAGRWRKLAGAD